MAQNKNKENIQITSIQKAKHDKELLEFSVEVVSKAFTHRIWCSNKGPAILKTNTHGEKFSFCVDLIDAGTLKVGDLLNPEEMENIVAW